ncbi:MAG TPA: hypothetical protein VGG08_06250 [Solirubrobacteraceae bacterium]
MSEDVVEIIDWTARLGAITAEALADRGGLSLATARGRLRGACRTGLMRSWHVLHGGPALFTVTREGLRVAELSGLTPGRVSAASARHALVCAASAAALERLYPARTLSGLPELRRRERLAGRALASAPMRDAGSGVTLLHRPDLVLWPGPDHEHTAPIAVEVELSVKAPVRLAAICRAWRRCPGIDGTIYLATADVLGPLSRAIERAHAGGRVIALELSSFAAPAPLAPAPRTRPPTPARTVPSAA